MKNSIFITGCSQGGIGDALAQEFHRLGWRVFPTVRSVSKAQHLADMGMEVVQLDVNDAESVKAAVNTVSAATGGKLNILLNNAGAGKHSWGQYCEC
jgi:1-acylglycerone phosphate reductase